MCGWGRGWYASVKNPGGVWFFFLKKKPVVFASYEFSDPIYVNGGISERVLLGRWRRRSRPVRVVCVQTSEAIFILFRPFRPSSFYSSSMTWQSLWTQYCNNNINNNNKISASRVCLLRASVMMHYPKCIVRAQIDNSQWREYNIRKVAINNWNEIISSRYAVPLKTITNME